MPHPALILAILAAAAPAQLPPSAPITVTGHAWAPFISPMGEPFRARSPADDTLANWFKRADRNGDGMLTQDEMVGDARRFFATLDTNGDGQIDPDELIYYEWEVAPDIQVTSKTRRSPGEASQRGVNADLEPKRESGTKRRQRSRDEEDQLGIGGGLQGAARYGLLNMPEPVAAADTDYNRAITLDEFRKAAAARFDLLDKGHQGRLDLAQLQALRSVALARNGGSKRDRKANDSRIGYGLPPAN